MDIMQLLNVAWPFVGLILLIYFFIQRPQAQAKKKHENLLASIKRGTKIVTVGGIYGTVTAVKKDTIMLSVAEKLEIEIARDAVSKHQDPERNG